MDNECIVNVDEKSNALLVRLQASNVHALELTGKYPVVGEQLTVFHLCVVDMLPTAAVKTTTTTTKTTPKTESHESFSFLS